MPPKKLRSPHLNLAHLYWKSHLLPEDIAIDATCGNGHDTLFLASLPLLQVISMDIQPSAIEKAKNLLKQHLGEEMNRKIRLLSMSHEAIDQILLPKSPKLIVYNLGYLPGGDKSMTTQTQTTLASLEKSLSILGENGFVSIICYPGHEEGAKEEAALLAFCQKLPFPNWQICHHRWINHNEKSPTLLWIHRVANS